VVQGWCHRRTGAEVGGAVAEVVQVVIVLVDAEQVV